MAEADDYLRAFLDQAAAEDAFITRLRQAREVQPREAAAPASSAAPVSSASAVSLMITNQQRAMLRARGFSDEAVRRMTPAEAHAQLGLDKPSL